VNICGPNLILLMIAIKWWLPGLGLCSSLVMIGHTCALPQTSAQFSDIRYKNFTVFRVSAGRYDAISIRTFGTKL